jgi:hypothetical protein
MLNAGKDLAAVLQALVEVSESTLDRSPVAAGGAESACKEAEKASSGLECQWMPSATG